MKNIFKTATWIIVIILLFSFNLSAKHKHKCSCKRKQCQILESRIAAVEAKAQANAQGLQDAQNQLQTKADVNFVNQIKTEIMASMVNHVAIQMEQFADQLGNVGKVTISVEQNPAPDNLGNVFFAKCNTGVVIGGGILSRSNDDRMISSFPVPPDDPIFSDPENGLTHLLNSWAVEGLFWDESPPIVFAVCLSQEVSSP